MSTFLSHLHDDLRRTRYTHRGATHAPKDVPRGTHKEYPRMESIALPAPAELGSLSEALRKRTSTNVAGGDVPLTLADYGTLLGSSLMRRPETISRNYPSGGALYPVETYLLAFTLDGVRPGIFHYHPTAHALERLWDIPERVTVKNLVGLPSWIYPSALIVFTAVWQRSAAKYGDLAYIHSLLEVGHMSENILLSSALMGLETRPMAGFNDALVLELLDLNELEEQPIHSITLSKGSLQKPRSESSEEE